MDQHGRTRSILDSLGEELIRIITPVSICMFMVVGLVSILNTDYLSSSSASFSSIATVAYSERGSDSDWDKFIGALLNSLVFVAVITVTTFVLVLLFYLRWTRFLKLYMGFSAFTVLGLLGGQISLLLIQGFRIPIDCITFLIVLVNFAVIGVLAVFMSKMPIIVTQGYLVVIGMLVAYCFTLLPEWTTWVLLVALALYDLAAVLLPVGPLRLLVELAISRDEDIPALVYEARPVIREDSGFVRRRVWRQSRNLGNDSTEIRNSESMSNPSVIPDTSQATDIGALAGDNSDAVRMVVAEEGRAVEGISELSAPLIGHLSASQLQRPVNSSQEENFLEGIGLGSSGAIKLGLGDFIFYSVMVGRAAMYDLMTVYACYLAIIAGLGITLVLLAFYQKALPALPFSIMLGVSFYFLTRFFLENFVMQCSSSLVMF